MVARGNRLDIAELLGNAFVFLLAGMHICVSTLLDSLDCLSVAPACGIRPLVRSSVLWIDDGCMIDSAFLTIQ